MEEFNCKITKPELIEQEIDLNFCFELVLSTVCDATSSNTTASIRVLSRIHSYDLCV